MLFIFKCILVFVCFGGWVPRHEVLGGEDLGEHQVRPSNLHEDQQVSCSNTATAGKVL